MLKLKATKWDKRGYKELSCVAGYFINRRGIVRNCKGRIIKPHKHNQGYLRVGLRRDGTGTQHKKYIHHLLAESFLENILGKRQVNHKNGKQWDNRLCNLEWATPSENVRHAINTGLLKPNIVGMIEYNKKYGVWNKGMRKGQR